MKVLEKERGHLDSVLILTLTPMHKSVVIQALKLGYAVVCEKPLATNAHGALKIS